MYNLSGYSIATSALSGMGLFIANLGASGADQRSQFGREDIVNRQARTYFLKREVGTAASIVIAASPLFLGQSDQPLPMGIFFSDLTAFARFGTMMRSTPLLKSALICASSMLSGSRNERSKLP